MPSLLLPVAIELSLLLIFFSVLYYLRKSLGAKGIIFWSAVWLVRAVGSVFAFPLLPRGEQTLLMFYTPVQVAVALALVIVSFRLQSQKEHVVRLNEELERLRRESTRIDVDSLTGLLNRAALLKYMESENAFHGQVVVCDLDDFKTLNDVYGHLVGDEVLHGIGKLIRGSIRQEDRAFRWGGDEFVVCFNKVSPDVAEGRMRALEKRLQSFYIRNHGPMRVRFSWGGAYCGGGPLREALDEADRRMYEFKRSRRALEPGTVGRNP